MEDLKLIGAILLGILTFICVMVGIIAGFATLASRHSCYVQLEHRNLQGNYVNWVGCMVKTKDTMVPLHTYNIKWAIQHGMPVNEQTLEHHER